MTKCEICTFCLGKKSNHTEESYIYPINPSEAMETEDNTIDVMDDAQAYIELIKENISYEHHMKYDKYMSIILFV